MALRIIIKNCVSKDSRSFQAICDELEMSDKTLRKYLNGKTVNSWVVERLVDFYKIQVAAPLVTRQIVS